MRKKNKQAILQAIGKALESFGRWLQGKPTGKAKATTAEPAKRKAGRPRKAKVEASQTPLLMGEAGAEV